jgi:hypothetical protein
VTKKDSQKVKQNASNLASEMSKTPHCDGCGISDHKLIGCNSECFKLAAQQAENAAKIAKLHTITKSDVQNTNVVDTHNLLAKLHQIKSVKKNNTKRSPTCTNSDHKIVGCNPICFSTINTTKGLKHAPTFGNKSTDNIARSADNKSRIAEIMALTGGGGGGSQSGFSGGG